MHGARHMETTFAATLGPGQSRVRCDWPGHGTRLELAAQYARAEPCSISRHAAHQAARRAVRAARHRRHLRLRAEQPELVRRRAADEAARVHRRVRSRRPDVLRDQWSSGRMARRRPVELHAADERRAPLVDPRDGDIEADASSTESRSLLAIAGNLLVEVSLPKFVLAFLLLVVLPALLLGITPVLASVWWSKVASNGVRGT